MSTTTETPDAPASAPPAPAAKKSKLIPLLAGIAAAALVFFLLPEDLNTPAKFVAATAILMAVWWMSEALPLAVTALLPLVLFPFLPADGGYVGFKAAAAPFANPIVFLYLGGFIIALAMQKWDLHRRFALSVLSRVGSKSTAIIGGFMLATGLLSMFVNNTATAVMMFPVGLAVLSLVTVDGKEDRNFSVALLLGIAYASSIGSVATVIGNVPNAFIKAYMEENHGVTIGFAQWMAAGLPVAVVFGVIAWLLLTRVAFRPAVKEVAGGREYFRQQLAELGPMRRADWMITAVFAGTSLTWISLGFLTLSDTVMEAAPWITAINDSGVVMAAAILLFLLPADRAGNRILVWDDTRELPWGLLLLFGGGLSLSTQITDTGLSAWIGGRLEFLGGVPVWVAVLAIAVIILLITEICSNTATTVTFLPLAAGLAAGFDMNVLILLIPAGLAANFAFMLPVATPPNAIVFGSGRIRVADMVRGGALLNAVAVLLVTLSVFTVFSWALM